MPEVGPAPVLALLVGLFHTGLYLMLRGAGGLWLPFTPVAAVLGAFAGQQLGARLGDPFMIGDFGLAWSSALAWLGILLIAAASMLSPSKGRAAK